MGGIGNTQVNINNLPEQLKKCGEWCVWRYEKDESGRDTKMPYNPRNTCYRAKSDTPSTFSDFETAFKLTKQGWGLGCRVSNGISAADLDHCIKNGQYSDLAVDLIDCLDCYTEISPSGDGLRFWFLTSGYKYDRDKYLIHNRNLRLEIYIEGNTNKFLTCTGNRIHGSDLVDRTDRLDNILDKYMKKCNESTKKREYISPFSSSPEMSDDEIIERASTAKNGWRFQELWSGGFGSCGSHSEADIALCSLLAFWTQDTEQIDRIFRRSGLIRDKWEKRKQYRDDTIRKALQSCSEFYTPKQEQPETYYKSETTKQEQKPVKPVILKSFNEIEEKTADWVISGLIPKGQITTMAGDGGVGKTSLWCSIAAAVSSGNNCFLDVPFWERSAGKVIIFSGEDSAEYVLKRRLRKHGADLNNVFTVAISDDSFEQIKFGSPLLESIIEQEKPDLVVFDPIQSFVDPKIKMGDRNAMRQSLIPVAGWGEKYGTTFLIILHSNKQSGAWGRRRMADSSDVWDMSRSVLMVGSTQDFEINYCSQEKSNYGKLSETHLFSIEDEIVTDKGTTVKRDRDFVLEQLHEQKRQAPARDNAREAVLEFLADGQPKFTKELDEYITAMSISKTSLRRAKDELKEEGLIRYIPGGGRSGGGWRVQKVNK